MLALNLKALGLGVTCVILTVVVLLFMSANTARMAENFATPGGVSISSRFFFF
jgi:hypothetical protein